MKSLHPQSGIAIAPILFIVALLAILATAIAAGTGTWSGNTNSEADVANAEAILSIAAELRAAVARVTMGHGCADTQISFENTVVDGYANANSPSNKSCHVFDINGGGLIFPTITATESESSLNRYFSFEGCIGAQGLGAYADWDAKGADLIAFLPVDSSTLCNAINSRVGMKDKTGTGWYEITTPWDSGDPYKFTGTYEYFGILNPHITGTWPNPPPVVGCITEGATADGQSGPAGARPKQWQGPLHANYLFYAVLLVR